MALVAEMDTAALLTGLFEPLAHQSIEVCAVAYLDAAGRLVGTRHVAGTIDTVGLSVRTVATDALTFGARATVVAHNHPSGDHRPSRADLAFTRRLARGLEALEVTLGDHVVLTRDGMTSLRMEGLL